MRKKLLFASLLFGSVFFAQAQDVIWSDDFEDEDISDWMIEDADGDGNNWGDMFTVNNSQGNPVTPVSLISRSWQGDPLTPDNWVISPEIDLTNVTAPISLNWVVQCAAATWSLENYTVYAATGDTPADLLTGISFNEIYPGGTSGASLPRSLDISNLAGQVIHIAFRHHDCTDQDFISIDDVEVTGMPLGVDSFFTRNFAAYPNPANSVLNISSRTGIEMTQIQLTDLNGRVVRNVNAGNITETQIDMSQLASGAYFLKVQSAQGSGVQKIIKN